MFENLAIDQQYPRQFHGDGPRVVFHPSGLEILFALSHPDAYEVGCFKCEHQTRIGFAKWDRLGVLLVDFGEGFSVEVPFDAGIEQPENVPALDIASDFSRIPFTLIGVDTTNDNRVFGIRYITASPRVSRLLAKTIKAQLAAPVDISTYTSRVAELYARYSTTRSLVKIALAYDRAGGEEQAEATQGAAATSAWPTEWGIPEVLASAIILLERSGLTIDDYLARILAGDYGLEGAILAGADESSIDARESIVILEEQAKIQKCELWEVDENKVPAVNVGIPRPHVNRLSGRRFTATFELQDAGLLYFSVNEHGRTIVCDSSDR